MTLVANSSFYIDVVREGLQSLIDGPVRDKNHPLHDPVSWLAESTSSVFDDSGLAHVLDRPDACDVLGRPLRESLDELGRALDEVSQEGARDISARRRIAALAAAVLADLDADPPSTAKTRGAPLA